MPKLKKILVFTSGGDAPGMNAAIRSVVRTADYLGIKVVGARKGYDGIIDNDIIDLPSTAVANIIHRGGTILQSARSERFTTREGREIAATNLAKNEVDAIVAIGGDGTFTGAHIFSKEHNIPVVGIPGTIDNDIFGTDYTIGFDTAVNTAVEALDKIRDTAESHSRIFFVEVMGRDAGFVAVRSGIAGGAVNIMLPEKPSDLTLFHEKLAKGWNRERKSMIVVVAEGSIEGGALAAAKITQEKFPNDDIKVSILGHMQRGGNPSSHDRVVASQMGLIAVESLVDGFSNVMIGLKGRKHIKVPLSEAVKQEHLLNTELLRLIDVLSS